MYTGITMPHDSQATKILGALNYEVTSEVYGSTDSLKKLARNQLLLPPLMWSACDLNNLHFSGIINAEPLDFAEGLLSEAKAFQEIWPKSQSVYKATMTSWVNSKVNLLLGQQSVPEWVAVANLFTKMDDLANPQYLRQIQARWWGLVSPYRTEYEAKGKAVTDEITTFFDRFSGYGRGMQYYPSLVESLISGKTETLSVISIDGTKRGVIKQAYDTKGQPCSNAMQAPFTVDVTWDDGSTEQISYLGVRQLDPILGKPMECRAQWTLSPIDDIGVPRQTNDFVRKMGAIILISGLEMKDGRGLPLTERIAKWSSMAGQYLQEVAKSETYMRMQETNASGDTVHGLETTLGKRIMEEVGEYLRSHPANIQGIGPKIAAFLDDEEVYPLGSVKDSGLVLCPHCKYCENISEADWKDFGIQCFGESDAMMSVRWNLMNQKRGYGFQAVGRLTCKSCGKDYYRKFYPVYKTFNSQLPVNSISTYLTPNVLIDDSRNGGSCGQGAVAAYTFLMPVNKGYSDETGLPRLRIFSRLGNLYRANDLPLEVGSQSRALQRVTFCSGKSIVKGARMGSHAYYDAFLAPKGKGLNMEDYTGLNRTDFNTGALGNRECAWCESVGRNAGEEVPTTLTEGSYFTGDSSFLSIERRGDGGRKFDRIDKDYDADVFEIMNPFTGQMEQEEHLNYYKIRLVGNNIIRYLHIKPDDLGIAIPVPDKTLAQNITYAKPPCPNEEANLLAPAKALYTKYLMAKATQEMSTPQVTVCEQLAYSARLGENGWEPALCPDRYQESLSFSFGHPLFTKTGENIQIETWAEGNKACWTPSGSIERFPTPPFTLQSASLIITPYADNRRSTKLKSYHILTQVGSDSEEVILASGDTCIKTTPYLWCRECENSYHGAPNLTEGKEWALPNAVGNEYKRPDSEVERRDDTGGGYSPTSKWNYTLPVYQWTEGKSVQDAILENPSKWRNMFPQEVIEWVQNGQKLPDLDIQDDADETEIESLSDEEGGE